MKKSRLYTIGLQEIPILKEFGKPVTCRNSIYVFHCIFWTFAYIFFRILKIHSKDNNNNVVYIHHMRKFVPKSNCFRYPHIKDMFMNSHWNEYCQDKWQNLCHFSTMANCAMNFLKTSWAKAYNWYFIFFSEICLAHKNRKFRNKHLCYAWKIFQNEGALFGFITEQFKNT